MCITDEGYSEWVKKNLTVNDIVLMPIEFDFRIDAKVLQNGEGLFPSVEAAMKKTNLKVKECSFVYNYAGIGMPEPKEEENDEDFDDDVDEFIMKKSDDGKRTKKITNTQRLGCGMVMPANVKILEFKEQIDAFSKRSFDYVMTWIKRFTN